MRDREGGFTLIELMIALAVLGIILAPLLGSIIVGLKTTDDTIQRIAESVDAQTAASLFVSDVQSSATTTVSDTICAPGNVNVIVSFEWKDYGNVATSTVDDYDRIASYVTQPPESPERAKDESGSGVSPTNLLRVDCSRQIGAWSAPESLNVATFLKPSVGPILECVPTSCPPTSTYVAITATEASGYKFRLSAKRRSTG